jgi:peptidoglycan/xylan/chitin deacetylase (PgdA/CDA1 family)
MQRNCGNIAARKVTWPAALRKLLRNAAKRALRLALHVLCLPFAPAGTRVLIYHSVDAIDSPISITPELFAAHMDYLVRKGYETWTASELVAALRAKRRIPRRVVVITFDDGYLNNITTALPILEARGLRATVFMVTGNDGDVPRWGERDRARIEKMIEHTHPGGAAEKAHALERTFATLTERIAWYDELAGAPARGLEVQSHTRTHPYMDELGDAELRDELAGSRADLESRGFGECRVLAWPYGAHDDRTIAAAAETGYHGTFLALPSWKRRHHPDPMRIARCSVDAELGLGGLRFQLGRGYDLWVWLRRLRGHGRD